MIKGKIHLVNLAILFGYLIILTAAFKDMVIIASIIPIAAQILINVILFLKNFNSNRSLSYTYLLSAFIVLLVGFPSCLGFGNLGVTLKA